MALGQHIAAKTLLTGGGGELHDYIIYMMGFFIVMTCNILCIVMTISIKIKFLFNFKIG